MCLRLYFYNFFLNENFKGNKENNIRDIILCKTIGKLYKVSVIFSKNTLVMHNILLIFKYLFILECMYIEIYRDVSLIIHRHNSEIH